MLTIKQFFSKNDQDFVPLTLKGLEVLSSLDRKKFSDLENTPEFNQIVNQLQNQTIRTTVIKNWPNEDFLFTVFLRLNTGSIKLSPQELRQALHPGPFIDFSDDFSIESNSIKKVLGISKPDYRMRDVELVIRFFTFKYFIHSYEGNLKKAFDNTVKSLNEDWSERETEIQNEAAKLDRAIELTIDIFGVKEAFSKWSNNKFQNNFNRAIFDLFTFYFSDDIIYDNAVSKKEEIKIAFKELCESDRSFVKSLEHTTKSIPNTHKRFDSWGKKLAEILGIAINIPALNEKNRFILENYSHG